MKSCFTFFIVVTFFSCTQNNENQNRTTVKDDEVETDTSMVETTTGHDTSSIIGMYVGYFESKKMNDRDNGSYRNKINIVIEKILDGDVTGYSVVAGNLRPFSGTIDQDNFVSVAEPGDDKYDGVFKFTCFPDEQLIKGDWIANDKKLAVSERQFKLTKTTFSYNPDLMLTVLDGNENNDFPFAHLIETQNEFNGDVEAITWDAVRINASNTLLKKEDVENLYKGDLEIIRNAIYARHGYSFKNRKMRYFFDSYVDWYIPLSIDVRNELTDIEKKNEDLLKRYEEHAETYYDYFGR